MAKIIHAGGAQVSGSIGATTYTRNGIARRRSNPVNTMSARKSEVQGFFAGFASMWRQLTQAERDAWNGSVQRTNSLGQVVTLKPMQAFMSVNQLLQSVNLGTAMTPPAFAAATGAQSPTLTVVVAADPDDVVVTIGCTNPTGTAISVIAELTRPMSPGIQNFKNRLRFCATNLFASPAIPYVATVEAIGTFGAESFNQSNAGKRYGLRLWDVNNGNPLLIGTASAIATSA